MPCVRSVQKQLVVVLMDATYRAYQAAERVKKDLIP